MARSSGWTKAAWWRRAGYAALAAGALMTAGHTTRAQAVNTEIGVDPLSVLDLQVKPNAVIVLDSSGSMRQHKDNSGVLFGATDGARISNGELVGDDPNSKLAQAKAVLRNVIAANDHKVRFRLGRYNQDGDPYNPSPGGHEPTQAGGGGDSVRDRFYYVTTNASAAALSINAAGTGASAPGLSRDPARHTEPLMIDHDSNPATAEQSVDHHYVVAGRFWNGEIVDVGTNAITCPSGTAPSGTPPRCPAGDKTNPASLTLKSGATLVTFRFAGSMFRRNAPGACNGFEEIAPLADCDLLDQLTGTKIGEALQPELLIKPDGDIDGYVDGALGGAPNALPTYGGIRASGGTPIARSLQNLKTWFNGYFGSLPAGQFKPRTYVIFVTDGDPTCEIDSGANTFDLRALEAAYQAQLLHDKVAGFSDAEASVTSYVIAYGADASATRANWMAWGGSGLKKAAASGRWTAAPTTTEVDNCKAAGGCTDAKLAANTQQLFDAIQAVIDQGSSSGKFAASPTQTDVVYEYGSVVSIDPRHPNQRYRAFVPLVFQPTFEAENFSGKFSAFRGGAAVGDPPILVWEADTKLRDRLTASLTTPSTFAALHGSSNPVSVGSSSALIKRRIYTTSGNGKFGPQPPEISAAGDPPGVVPVALWPPSSLFLTGDAPSSLDGELLGAAVTGTDAEQLTKLKTTFAACRGVIPVGHACEATQPVTVQRDRARREAREMVLAFAAGAKVQPSSTTTGPERNATGDILYVVRDGLIAESTFSVPAIVTPPIEDVPLNHSAEYILYRDGPRVAGVAVNAIDRGFGLRNPDRDKLDPPPTTPTANPTSTTTSQPNNNIKPVMTMVYLGTNQMLHALRAGGCGGVACVGRPAGFLDDTGGEEVWGFIPYDQLPKIAERMQPIKRNPHAYMIAASPRFADVFVPGAFTDSGVTGSGKWRVVLMFGRGIGGKFFTALDVTVPGPFTRHSMAANINPPLVLWNRGNPDVDQPTDYSRMGQTWSTPALTRTDAIITGTEYVAYVGSGFAPAPTTSAEEGKTLFALNLLNGDVLARQSVPDGSGTVDANGVPIANALVAPPTAFVPRRVSAGFVGNATGGTAKRIYIGDLHGRLWSFDTALSVLGAPVEVADLGANQPITAGLSVLNMNSDSTTEKAHIYLATGGDRRVRPPGDAAPFQTTPPFYMVGIRDDETGSSVSCPSDDACLFREEFPRFPSASGPGFRGTVAPVAGFNEDANPRVFFAGTQFTPPGTECNSSLDSVLFALTGVKGEAAFDLNASGDDAFMIFQDQVITQLQIARTHDDGGELSISKGLGKQGIPPPPPPPPDASNQPTPGNANVFALDVRLTSPVCRQ